MQRSRSRFFPLFLIIIVFVIIVVAVISIGRAIFTSTQPSTQETDTDPGQTALLSTAVNHSVSLTVRGPIVANESFRSYSITVSPGSRIMNIYTGYLDSIQNSKTLDNNSQAYEQFVFALDKANMMKGTMPRDDAANDLRGICATGFIYEYSVLVDNSSVKHLWTSTCSGSKGTLDASVTQLNNLFLAQIPDANTLNPFSQSSVTQLRL